MLENEFHSNGVRSNKLLKILTMNNSLNVLIDTTYEADRYVSKILYILK